MHLSYSQFVSVTNALSHFQGRIHQIEYAMEAVKQVKQKRVASLAVYSLIPDPSPWGEVWE